MSVFVLKELPASAEATLKRCGELERKCIDRFRQSIEDSPAEALQPANKAHQEKTHDIVYLRDNRGQMLGSCFPCCEECWQKSNLEERLKYARTLCDAWRIDQHYAPAEWNLNDDIDAKQVLIEAEIHREWEAKQRNEITPIDN